MSCQGSEDPVLSCRISGTGHELVLSLTVREGESLSIRVTRYRDSDGGAPLEEVVTERTGTMTSERYESATCGETIECTRIVMK